MKLRFSIAFRLYAIVGLSFVGLVGLAAVQVNNLASSLHQQRQNELKHLSEVALNIVREEHETAARNGSSDEGAREKAASRIGAIRYGSGDYFWINDMKPVMVMHPLKPELNGKDLSDIRDPNGKKLFVEFADIARRQKQGFVDYEWPKPGKEAPQPKLSFVTSYEPWGWVIGTGVYMDDLQSQVRESARNVIIAASVILLLIGGVTLLLARRTSKDLTTMTGALNKLGEGDFSVELPGLDRGNELGDMARSIDQFRIKAAEKARREALLEDERRQTTEQAKRKALQEMADSVERATKMAVEEVAGGTDRMARNASRMTDTALTLENNSSSVAAAAEEALANAQTVAKAASQLAASISQIAGQVSASRSLTLEAVTASTEAQVTISKLSDAATRVGTVTNLISEIAGQTNLLALNATIEAARAGIAGRGFAVVASEVKSLAEQTAKATSEIAQQINEIQEVTQASVASIHTIGEVIRNVEQVSSQISAAMEEQNAVTSEISRTVEETSYAAKEVAAQISSVSAEATETGRRASEIRDGSSLIAGKVDELRETLIRVIRTSTADVDRRLSARLPLRREGTLTYRGMPARVQVRDIALHGVLIEDALLQIPLQSQVAVRVDGIPIDLTGVVDRKDRETALVRLTLTDQARQLLPTLLDPTSQSHAA
jgi:methyl-accepting chemotaxis protein